MKILLILLGYLASAQIEFGKVNFENIFTNDKKTASIKFTEEFKSYP